MALASRTHFQMPKGYTDVNVIDEMSTIDINCFALACLLVYVSFCFSNFMTMLGPQ